MGNLSLGIAGSSYYDWAKLGKIYSCMATVTAPVIYTTAAGTGGPLLWNNSGVGSQSVVAAILAVSADVTTASAVAATLGLTGNSGQSSAPSSTTAIDAGPANTFIGGGGGPAQCNVYRKGTVANAGNFFIPTHTLDTGAITTVAMLPAWVDIGGIVLVPPGSWCSVSPTATATSCVANIGLVWVEIPLD